MTVRSQQEVPDLVRHRVSQEEVDVEAEERGHFCRTVQVDASDGAEKHPARRLRLAVAVLTVLLIAALAVISLLLWWQP